MKDPLNEVIESHLRANFHGDRERFYRMSGLGSRQNYYHLRDNPEGTDLGKLRRIVKADPSITDEEIIRIVRKR
jgi:hypothetical protein